MGKLVDFWKEAKKNAEKARGSGDKPGGGSQGFEKDIKALEDLLNANNPDTPKITTAITNLTNKFNAYALRLGNTEPILKKGCADMVKMLARIQTGVNAVGAAVNANETKYRAARIQFQQIEAVTAVLQDDIEQCRRDVKAATEVRGNRGLELVKAEAKKLEKLQDKMQALEKDYGKATNKVMDAQPVDMGRLQQ